MDGIFAQKKFISPLGFISLLGIFLIGLFVFLPLLDPEAAQGRLSFLIMGILLELVTIPLLTFNRGAFFHVSEDRIQAKFHWFGKMDCKLSDVTFVFPQINTLTVYLKNGKYYTVMGISNSFPLTSFLSRRISFEVKDPPEVLIGKYNQLNKSRKKDMILCCVALAIMMVSPFILLFLTEERELYEFSQTDWILTAIIGIIGTVSVILTFYFAQKAGKKNIPIAKSLYDIRRTVIETAPLPIGHAIKVFTDEDARERLTVFGYPNSDSVHYTVEQVNFDFSLCRTYESQTFKSITEQEIAFDGLIDITGKFFNPLD